VNATPVEARLGTDLIYYHEATHSFVLVQYKRLDRYRSIYVDERLRDQMDRLDAVAKLSTAPTKPADWRLGADACFLKLARWPERTTYTWDLIPGICLPLSYARLLLKDDSTLGERGGRILSYGRIERYLDSSRFIDLVKEGFVGTVGTSIEQLRNLGAKRAEDGYSVVVAAERSPETLRERQQRVRGRGSKRKASSERVQHGQPTLFEVETPRPRPLPGMCE
jgi:hypothetical protein